ncbi:MAG: hypothetical protein JW388_1575 [Nitrospira sp.]|nr:hypothetical protein [Nitrospira sp.]
MARAMVEKIGIGQFDTHYVPSVIRREPACSRCKGLMVNYSCGGSLESAGGLELTGRRCVQCGDVVDPIILQNREAGHQLSLASLAHTPKKSSPSKGLGRS